MSRKTRKQKLAAQQRRSVQANVQLNVPQQKSLASPDRLPTFNPLSSYSLPLTATHSASTSSASPAASNRSLVDFSYVLSDLKRIAILTALAFCAQVVLWYFLGRS